MLKYALFFFVSSFLLLGHYSAKAEVMTYESYIENVRNYHPLAKQIRLLRKKADLNLMYAKGGLDPKLNANADYKSFDGTHYFTLITSGLSVPTIWGIKLEGGYNFTAGEYYNPENKLPSAGQAYLGVAVPLANGLIINERRTAIESAEINQDASEAEIDNLLNDLLYDAALAYWDWAEAYYEVQLFEEAVVLSETRLETYRQSFFVGDKPAIDTLEAYLKVQDRILSVLNAELKLQKARLHLSNYLWDDTGLPLELLPTTTPSDVNIFNIEQPDTEEINNQISTMLNEHPSLLTYDYKLDVLNIEERLKRNKLLPKLEFKYNFLANNAVDFWSSNAFIENYKFGAKLSFPIFVRKERADLQLNQIKQQETQFKQSDKQRNLENKAYAFSTELQLVADQYDQAASMIVNYQTLLDAENEKFSIGESSILLINLREDALVKARQKVLSVRVKYIKARTGLIWILAQL